MKFDSTILFKYLEIRHSNRKWGIKTWDSYHQKLRSAGRAGLQNEAFTSWKNDRVKVRVEIIFQLKPISKWEYST